MRGTITDIIPAKHGFEIIIDVGFALYALLTADGINRLSIKPGDQVYASFKASALRFIKK
jgi:molybdopterin-binding protein